MPYPVRKNNQVPFSERETNQRRLQEKLAEKERTRWMKEAWIVDTVRPMVSDRQQEELEREMRNVRARLEQEEWQQKEKAAALAAERAKYVAAIEMAMAAEDQKPWDDGMWLKPRNPTYSFPFILTPSIKLYDFLNAQLMSSARAEVIRAEILEAPSNGIVKVCVVFRRSGSSFVDQFSLMLSDIARFGGLANSVYEGLKEMDKPSVSEPLAQTPLTYTFGFNPSKLDLLNQAAIGAEYKKKEQKPITPMDVIENPGNRMIEV